jgi:hypothetical protein
MPLHFIINGLSPVKHQGLFCVLKGKRPNSNYLSQNTVQVLDQFSEAVCKKTNNTAVLSKKAQSLLNTDE